MCVGSRQTLQAHGWLPDKSHAHSAGLRGLVSYMRHDSSVWALLHLPWQLFALCCSNMMGRRASAGSWGEAYSPSSGTAYHDRAPAALTSCVLQIVKVFEQILYAADEREAKEVSMAQIFRASLLQLEAVRVALMLGLRLTKLALGICCGHCGAILYLLHMQVMSQAMMQHVQQPAPGT